MAMSKTNTFMSHGSVNEDAESPDIDAAHGLLSRGISATEVATILAQERGISLRQAYRYLEQARTIRRAVPVGEPLVPATFKIPRDVLARLRAYSASSGLTLSAIVTRALERSLTVTRRRGRHG